MLSSVTPSDRYESLENHILRKRSRPTSSVSGFDVSARQPVRIPNTNIPGIRNPIPASSARPGKMTNQNIPYLRLMHVFPNGSNTLVNQTIQQTEIVFVNRNVYMGVSTNRTSKICNIAQMNAALADHSMPHSLGKSTMPLIPYPTPPKFGDTALTWEERWAMCSEVQSWLPDGVVLTAEHQHEQPYNIGNDNSNSGEAFNVVVQGPVLCEKADMILGTLDIVFLCLLATPNAAKGTDPAFWTFQWRLQTHADLLDADDIACAFKIGKVLDTFPKKNKVTLNVCIEEILPSFIFPDPPDAEL